MPTCPGCQVELDVFDDHLLCCPRNNFSLRHCAMQEALASVLQGCGQPFSKEVQFPSGPHPNLRPADLLLPSWCASLPTAVDLTISHGAQVSEDAASLERRRGFLRRREKMKHDKYDVVCQAESWAFIPMAFGTWGGLGSECAKFMSRILRRGALSQTPAVDDTAVDGYAEDLRQQVGLALMRHVWRMLATRNYVQ